MKTTIAISLLSGALLASAGMNVYCLRESAPPGVPCAGEYAPCEAASQPTCQMVKRLGLTTGQCQEIFGCCGGVCGRQRDELGRRIGVRMAELERALNAEQLDRRRIDELAGEIAELRAKRWKDRIQCVLRVRETLTPEQLERLVATVEGP